MNDNDYIMILPKRGLKTSSYKMNMNKKDLKRLSKSQLIKLLIKQEKNGHANEFENSIVPQPKQEESLQVRALMVTKTLLSNHQNNSEINKRNKDTQSQLESHLHHQRTLSILTMTYSKPKTKALKNSKSLAYKADKTRNS